MSAFPLGDDVHRRNEPPSSGGSLPPARREAEGGASQTPSGEFRGVFDDHDFSGKDLTNQDFTEGSLDRAKFCRAKLDGATFRNALLTDADFTDASGLRSNQFPGAVHSGTPSQHDVSICAYKKPRNALWTHPSYVNRCGHEVALNPQWAASYGEPGDGF
jgi:hypothetical protein